MSQKHPGNCSLALKSLTFKESLLSSLVGFCSSDQLTYLFNFKILCVNCSGKFINIILTMIRWSAKRFLRCTPLTKKQISNYFKSNLPPLCAITKTVDTFGLIIVLACKLNYNKQIIVWMEAGPHTFHQHW